MDFSPTSGEATLPADLNLPAARIRIYIASLLIDASTVGFSIALSCHAKEALNATYGQLGMLGALTALCYSLTCFLTGGFSDRLGSRPFMFTSLALMSATFVGTTFVGKMPVQTDYQQLQAYNYLLLAGACMGISLALFWPPIQRKLSRLSPGKSLLISLGKFNVLWSIGVGIGILGTPLLYAWLKLFPTLLAGLVITVAAVPILAIRMPEPPQEESDCPSRFGPNTTPARARFFLHQAWIANFTTFFAFVGIVRLFPKITGVMGIEIGKMGWLLAPLDVGKIIMFVLLARLSFWHYSFGWLAASQAAAGLALVVAGLLEEWILFVLLFPVVGALSGLTYFSSIYYGLNLREREGKKSGIHETVLSGGVCLGPLICGWVGDRFPKHPGAAIFFGGLVILLGLCIQLWNHRILVLSRTDQR